MRGMSHHANDADAEDGSNEAVCGVAAILEHVCANVTANRALRSDCTYAAISMVGVVAVRARMPSWCGDSKL